MASTITYATVVACLNQDINQPCPVGVGTYNPDDERYDHVKNNAEAVIVLQKPQLEYRPTDEPSETEVDPQEKPTQAEAQQDTSLTDEGEEVFGVDAGPEMPVGPDASVETSDPFVKDDFLIEVVASSMERLSEIITWVNEKLMHLTHGDAIRDHVCFADYQALAVGSETRYVTYAPAQVEEEVDEE